MRRALVSLYNSFAHILLSCVVIFAICFIGNIWLTQSIDAAPQMPLVPALLIDGSLLFLFMLFKSAKANANFKRYWNRFIPDSIDRATYIILSSILAALIIWQWQPIGRVVWEISNDTISTVFRIVYIDGWVIIFVGFLLNHRRDPFRLKQYWLHFKNRPFQKSTFKSLFAHKLVRNPFYLGMLICLWCAPVMTVSHLFFAMLFTLYVITVFQLEEKNLTISYRNSERSRAFRGLERSHKKMEGVEP